MEEFQCFQCDKTFFISVEKTMSPSCAHCGSAFVARPEFTGEPPSKILDHIYLGSYSSAKDKKLLQSLGITHIINCAKECENCHEGSFHYLRADVWDEPTEPLLGFFPKAVEFINTRHQSDPIGDPNAPRNVLIHCMAGISRSSSVTIAYLMQTEGKSYSVAHEFVRERRSMIYPGFISQLLEYESVLKKKSAALL